MNITIFKPKSNYNIKMLKYLVLCLMIMFTFTMSGCNSGDGDTKEPNGNGNTNNTTSGKISDYYPFSKDTIFHYKGVGNEYAQKDVAVDFIKGNRIQLRTDNGGTVAVSVIENKDGELKLIYSQGECYYRWDFTGMVGPDTEVLLKEPLVKGTKWTLTGGSERYISAVDKEIETPLAIYNTIEVTTKSGNDITHDYYARGIGLVKSEFISNGLTISSSLERLETDVAATQSIKFYHPYFDKDKVAYIERNIDLHTNEDIVPILEKYMKEKPNNDLSVDLSKNVKIKSLEVDSLRNEVVVDFSKELVTGMNAGSGLESMILQSITNTIGDYYGVDKVYITVDGEPYSSGHIAMGKDEPFDVDYENAIKYQ